MFAGKRNVRNDQQINQSAPLASVFRSRPGKGIRDKGEGRNEAFFVLEY